MARVIFRPAYEIEPGDEVSLNFGPDQYSEWHGAVTVMDKTTDEDGYVILTLSVKPGTMVRSKERVK